MIAKYTPGPWYLIGDPKTEVAADNDGKPIVIADTRFFREQTNPNEVADARLIASAPDLLAACKWALSKLYASVEGQPVYSLSMDDPGLLLLRAAIAKAEGE